MRPNKILLIALSSLLTTQLLACHQTLQVGPPHQNDAAVRDGAVNDTVLPWYARNEAYLGDEMRLPVPESMTLERDFEEARLTPISMVPGPDDSLLVVQGNRLAAFDWGPQGLRMLTPAGGVRVAATGDVTLVPHRRIALVDQGDTWGAAFSGAPDWSSTSDLVAGFQAPELADFSTATATNGNSLAVASVRSDVGVRRAFFFVSPAAIDGGAVYDPDPDIADDVPFGAFYRSTQHVLVDRERFLLARIRRRYSSETVEVLLDEFTSTSSAPWRNIGRNFVGGFAPNWFQAALGGDHALTVYGRLPQYGSRGNASYRIVNISGAPEFGPTFDMDEINPGSVGAVAWDEGRTAFVVALGVHSAELHSLSFALLHTALYRIALDGTRVHVADVPFHNVSLTSWRGEVWGAGIDEHGELQIFSTTGEQAVRASVAHLAGPQQLHGLVLHDGAPMALWADGAHKAAVTRVNLASGVSVESRALVPDGVIDTPTLDPRFLRDGAALFVASAVDDGGMLMQIDSGNPANEQRHVFRSTAIGGPLWPLHVHGNTVLWRALYRTGQFSSMTAAFDRGSATQIDFHGISNAGVDCVDSRCVTNGRSSPELVFDADREFNLRTWATTDAATFPRCSTATDFPFAKTVRSDRVFFERDSLTGACNARVMPFADPSVPYVCAASTTPGETCGDVLAGAYTDTHTLLVETRVALNAVNKVELRLYANEGTRLLRTLTLPLAVDDQTGTGRELIRATSRLLHVRGGLFVLAYSRTGASGVAESYLRVVYFPEAESAVQ